MEQAISRAALETIRAHAGAEPDREVCGLLLGRDGLIEEACPAANVAPDPARHFEIDPAALFAAIRAERAGGPALIGYYHSHPNGRPAPSARDAADAARDGKVWIIAAGEEIGAWRSTERGFKPVQLDAFS